MRCTLALWASHILLGGTVAAFPLSGYESLSSSSVTSHSVTAFNTSVSSTNTSNFNSSTPSYLVSLDREKPTYTTMSVTTSVALSTSMGASAASTPHLPEQTPPATTRYPTTPSISANSSLLMNGTNSIGDVLALSEAFASSMVHYAERQNISDADLIFEICSPTAVRNATKNLSHTDLNVLVQTCAAVGLEEDHTTLSYLTNSTNALRYNLSGLSPESSLRRLSKAAKFALPQFGRGGCMDDFGYFEMTAKNLEESGVWDWYQEWTQEARSGQLGPRFAAYGEVRLFGQVFLGDDDYDCGLEMGGCTKRPSCSSIMMLYPGDRDLVRKIYFVVKLHNTLNRVLKTYYDALLTSHVNVAALVEVITKTCTQRVSAEAAKTCAFIHTSVSNMVDFVSEIGISAVMSSMVMASPAALALVPGKILDVPAPVFLFGKALRIWRMWNAKAVGGAKKISRLCHGLGVVKMDDPSHVNLLRDGLFTMSQEYRKSLSASTKQLNRGTFFDGSDPSALSLMMGSTIWANETGIVQILTDPYQMEEHMTKAIKEGLMAASYRASKCFMKCTTHAQAPLFCEGFNDWEFSDGPIEKYGTPGDGHSPLSSKAELESQMRVCPRPDKVCQIECWSQEKRGFSMPMHGFTTIQGPPLNFDVKNAMVRLYEYYKTNGNKDPHVDWGSDPSGKFDGTAPRFWLPVCDSDAGYVHIADWGRQGNHLSDNVDRRAFPLSCGSYRSDETEAFIKAVGMTNYDPKAASFPLDPLYKKYAPKTLSSIIEAPLDSFLAFCALGISYPQDNHAAAVTPFRFKSEHSRFCEPIMEETKGMDWYVANMHFCEHSETAQELFKAQRPTPTRIVAGMARVVGHKELCSRWVSSEIARFVNAGDEAGKEPQKKGERGYFSGLGAKDWKGKGNGRG